MQAKYYSQPEGLQIHIYSFTTGATLNIITSCQRKYRKCRPIILGVLTNVASKLNQGSSLKKVNVAQDLAVKLQILLGAFSLDLYQKNVDFLADHPVPDIRGEREREKSRSMGLTWDSVIILLQTYSSK